MVLGKQNGVAQVNPAASLLFAKMWRPEASRPGPDPCFDSSSSSSRDLFGPQFPLPRNE